jgi:hypothetical protein
LPLFKSIRDGRYPIANRIRIATLRIYDLPLEKHIRPITRDKRSPGKRIYIYLSLSPQVAFGFLAAAIAFLVLGQYLPCELLIDVESQRKIITRSGRSIYNVILYLSRNAAASSERRPARRIFLVRRALLVHGAFLFTNKEAHRLKTKVCPVRRDGRPSAASACERFIFGIRHRKLCFMTPRWN